MTSDDAPDAEGPAAGDGDAAGGEEPTVDGDVSAAADNRLDDGEAEGAADDGATGGEVEERPLHERAAEHDEALAEDVAALERSVAALESERAELRERVAELEEELEERTDQLKRARADFQNYKKRAERRREQLEERATEDLVERLLDVRDNLARALEAEGDVREGVEATLRSFDRVLEEESVERVEPDPGSAVDPERHEVMARVESDEPADAIADVYRPGYVMGDKVLRPAQVTVSEGGPASGEDGADATDGDADADDGGAAGR